MQANPKAFSRATIRSPIRRFRTSSATPVPITARAKRVGGMKLVQV